MENAVQITVIDREGEKHQLEAPTDMALNLMEVMKMYELPVEGTCGGMAMCASCQVYVHSTEHELPEMSDDEDNMLEDTFVREDNSRLGCQLHIHDELDGLVVELAPYDA